MTSAQVKAAAKGFGADLVGIAGFEYFRGLPAEINPLSIHAGARSVIVLGRKVLRGALRGVEQGCELGNAYPQFGFLLLEDNFLAKTTYDVSIWCEARGFEAVPLFAYDVDGQPAGVPVAPNKPAPNVILQYRLLAQAAGLGETGLAGLFLTPRFGPRQRFAMLVSDAELEPDAPFQPRLCDDCGACVKGCPLDALDADAAKPFGLPGYERRVAARDNNRCLQCRNGAVQTNAGRFNTVDRLAAACNRACIDALDRRGILEEKFDSPFRQAPAWGRDRLGNPVA
jgi:ferredoxin